MRDQAKNVLIGLFVITALSIFTYILLFLDPGVGDEGQTIKVRFSNIDKVAEGTRVLFGGHPIGEVVSIKEIEGARQDPQAIGGDVYIYELILKIDSSIRIYTTDEISARTSGLLGEKSVEITPRPAPPGTPLIEVTDQILFATSPQSIEEAIKDITELMIQGRLLINKIIGQIDNMENGELMKNLSGSLKNINDITSGMNRPKEWSHIVENLSDITSSAREVFRKMDNKESTVGRLLTQDDLYLRFTSVMSKAETLMDDINHYGLLFHNNDTWKRLRARRINLLAKLSTPQEFNNYFSDEVDQISTSLARVSTVLRQTYSDDITPVIASPEFEKVFADLLRRIEGIEDNIKLYNQQVVEAREKYDGRNPLLSH